VMPNARTTATIRKAYAANLKNRRKGVLLARIRAR
jgi:hypothetical protein